MDITFPDVEKAEWLNKIIAQMWPFIGQYLEKLLTDNIGPMLRSSNAHLSTLYFTKVSVGEKAPKIIGVKAHTELDKKQITLDLHISYVGDMQVDVEVKKYFCKAGFNGIQLHGMLRVILEPLIGDVPIVGAITMFFIRRPMLDLNWTGLTNLLDIPGLNSMSDTMIMDIISGFLVLPNRLVIPLSSELHTAELRSPLPRGIVRIHLIEAQNLPAKDIQLGGILAGKSDPYAILRVGTQVFTSRVINENLNPVWREMYEVVVHEVPGQELDVELFDKDPDQDDFLGRMKLDLGEVKKNFVVDKWFPLKDTKSGKLHLRLEWLTLMSNTSQFEQIMKINREITVKTQEEPSAAILIIYLDRAQDLPLKKGSKEPNAMVQLSIQDVTRESKTVYNSSNPVWEEPLRFFLREPSLQDLDIQVKDDDRQFSLGSLSIPLGRILSADHLTLDQWFQLDNSGPRSRIYLKLVMRILYLDPANIPLCTNTGSPEEETAAVGSSVDCPPRPLKTSIPESFAKEHVIRVFLLEAENLIAKDNLMGGMIKGKSDPYTVIRYGGKSLKTRVVENNLNPKWNQAFEILVTDIPGQEIVFEVFDKDLDKDDRLGSCRISVKKVIKDGSIDEWFTLEDVKSGRLHVKLECLSFVTESEQLDQVMLVNSLTQPSQSEEFSAAILWVFIDRACDLQMRKKEQYPQTNVELSVRKNTFKTKTSKKTSNPAWDESFLFLIKNPSSEILNLQIRDDTHAILGSLTFPLSNLLTAECLTIDGWFPLNTPGPLSQILMRLQMKILRSPNVNPEIQALSEAPSSLPPRPPSSQKMPDAESDDILLPSDDNEASSQGNLRQRQTHGDRDSPSTDAETRQLHLTIYYPTTENRLVVIVNSCRNLNTGREPPDSYVSMILLPDKSRNTKRKTSVKKKSNNPEFNERFEWDMSLEDVRRRKLDISVKNSVSFMSREKEVIGKVQIDMSQVDLTKGLKQWYDLSEQSSV
ncbi:extended synaptotagmin-1 isoform 2-T3 [Discoglossus pictus]